MAYTAPRTWIASEVPGASTFNTHVRDNLIHIAGTTGLVLASTLYQSVATEETTTSGTAADLATVGPTVTVPAAGDYLAYYGSMCKNSDTTREPRVHLVVNAATDETQGPGAPGIAQFVHFARFRPFTTTGAHVVKLQYSRDTAGTAGFRHRFLIVWAVR